MNNLINASLITLLFATTTSAQIYTSSVGVENTGDRVGIGISNPAAFLNIKGPTVKIESISGTAHTWLPYVNGEIYLTADKDGSGDGDIHFRTYSDAESYVNRMVITGEGHVGLGTDTPDAAWFSDHSLQISGVRPTMAFTPEQVGGLATIQWLGKSSSSQIDLNYGDTDNSLSFYSYSVNNEILRIQGNGNIGIGMTNPTAQLHVKTSGLPLKINSNDNINPPTSTALFLHQNGAGGNFNQQNSKVVFSPDGTSYAGSLGVIGITRDIDQTPHRSRLQVGSDTKPNILSLDLDLQRVGIGGIYRPGYTLHVNGNAYSTGGWSGSDARFKKNIEPLSHSLDRVMQLRGVSFDWRHDEFADRTFSQSREIGFIAQEVEKVAPEVVHTAEDGYKAVAYEKLTALLAEAIEEVKREKDAEIAALRQEKDTELAELRQEVSAMRQGLAELKATVLALSADSRSSSHPNEAGRALDNSSASISTSPSEITNNQNQRK